MSHPAASTAAPADAGGTRGHWSRRTTLELGALLTLGLLYTLVRAAQGTDVHAAMANATMVAQAEGWLFENVERPLNLGLSAVPLLAVPACYFYAVFHYAATPFVLYRSWRAGGWLYRRGLWSLVLATGIALIVYATFPMAPPRLVPDLGSVDTMRDFAAFGWWGGAASAPRAIGDATNQYAAMPSLHFGWSLWCALQMWGLPGLRWRVAAIVYPALQALVVVATANHFVLDVVGGAACVIVATLIVSGCRRLRA